MVTFNLCISAHLRNLTNLQPYDGCDSPSFPYYLKLRCTTCLEQTPKFVCVTLQDVATHDNKTVSLKRQCKVCENTGTVTLIPGIGRPLCTADSVRRRAAPLMQLDCSGYEPVDCTFGRGWRAFSTIDGALVEVDLSLGTFEQRVGPRGEARVTVENAEGVFTQVVSRRKK